MRAKDRWPVAELGPSFIELFDELLLTNQQPLEAVFVERCRTPTAIVSCLRCILGYKNEVCVDILLLAVLKRQRDVGADSTEKRMRFFPTVWIAQDGNQNFVFVVWSNETQEPFNDF